jgi:hypothetical protein
MLGSASAPKEPNALSAMSAFALSESAEDHMSPEIDRSTRTNLSKVYGQCEV